MRERALPILPIPTNYYEDLDARWELDPALLETMRTFGILYDRDEAGGELFHLYTGMLGHRLFLEVVQRVGGYEGYGEVNAPVRAAAQLATVDDAARRQGRTVGCPQIERNPLSDG
jgi:4-hydroxyphenylpyruvate dioxygenase